MTYIAKQRGTHACSSPVPCLVNRTFEGIVLFPADLLSPDNILNSRPLTRKRKAETSPVTDQPGVQPDDRGSGAVQPKSSKLAHLQLHGHTPFVVALPVSRSFGPHSSLPGTVSKDSPTASGHDCREWWTAFSRCSLDSSAVLQAALTLKPADVAADSCGFQLANIVEAVRAGCKLPLPNSHGLPTALQATAHAAPLTHQMRNHMATQLASIYNSAVWLRHLEHVFCRTEACTLANGSASPACKPKQGKLPLALDTGTPQGTADNRGAASPVELQPVAASQGAASPVELQPVAASQVGNATTYLDANPAVEAVPSSPCTHIAAKTGAAAADATGHLPHHQAAPACCNNDIHHCEAHLQSQNQGPRAARSASRLEAPAAPLTAANLFSLHTALAAPSSKRDDAKHGLNGTHRQQSSILHRHHHCLRQPPAGSYSMQTSGSSRPPWDSSSQGTHSVKRSASMGQVEDAGGGDTDSPQAVLRRCACACRLVASMKRPFIGAAHRSVKKVNADYRSHVEYRRQSGYMQGASDLQ
ncbi:hypothetical protein WJX77_009681 [Trebouxia sp. C0004]